MFEILLEIIFWLVMDTTDSKGRFSFRKFIAMITFFASAGLIAHAVYGENPMLWHWFIPSALIFVITFFWKPLSALYRMIIATLPKPIT